MELVLASGKYVEEIIAAINDFSNNGETKIYGSSKLMKYQNNLNEWFEYLEKIKLGSLYKEGYTPTKQYLMIEDNNVVGFICAREDVAKDFEPIRGHIGYAVCPKERGKGYASKALNKIVKIYKEMNYTHISVCCYTTNNSSRKVVEHNRGKLKTITNYEGKDVAHYVIEIV